MDKYYIMLADVVFGDLEVNHLRKGMFIKDVGSNMFVNSKMHGTYQQMNQLDRQVFRLLLGENSKLILELPN